MALKIFSTSPEKILEKAKIRLLFKIRSVERSLTFEKLLLTRSTMRTFLSIFFLLILTVSAAAQQNLQPGNPAPVFASESLDGKMYNLSELQGKVVVLTFWSTRCEICHNEIPKLNRVADRYREKGVVFLAPTMDNQAKIGPYIKKNPFNFDILPNSFGVMLKYADMDKGGNINMGFPAYYLIDQKGAIRLKSSGWDKIAGIESQITKLLSE